MTTFTVSTDLKFQKLTARSLASVIKRITRTKAEAYSWGRFVTITQYSKGRKVDHWEIDLYEVVGV